jgi:hypothetical protein
VQREDGVIETVPVTDEWIEIDKRENESYEGGRQPVNDVREEALMFVGMGKH